MKNRKCTAYLAAPLFSEAERAYNYHIRDSLSDLIEVFLPQDSGYLFSHLVGSGVESNNAARLVFEADLNAIKKTDLFLILLDGRSVDEGASFELGYAFSLGIVCVGLQTDMRQLLPFGNNPMITSALSTIAHSLPELRDWCLDFLVAKDFEIIKIDSFRD